MALKTLKNCVKIGGFQVVREKWKNMSWDEFDDMRKHYPIHITDKKNTISFRIQDGPVKENGVNGCQVDTIIEAAMIMVQGLDEEFPCEENKGAITGLEIALKFLGARKKDREKRKVEGRKLH